MITTLLVLLLAGCAGSRGDDSEREWQRAECNRVIDPEARERCFKRIDADYGSSRADTKPKEQPRR